MGNLVDIRNNWDDFGKEDPLWAISSRKDKKGCKWNKEEFFQQGNDEIDMIMNRIESLNIEMDYGRALDFGCGVGRLTQALARYFNKVDGVDIAQSMIDLAIIYNKYGESVRYLLNIVDNLDILESTTYDFIYTADVLQHLNPNYSQTYLKEFIRLLSPKGLLVFQIPSENRSMINNCLYAKLGINNYFCSIYSKIKNEPFMEYHYMKKGKIEKFLQKNNGKIVDIMNDPRSNVISYRYFVTKLQTI